MASQVKRERRVWAGATYAQPILALKRDRQRREEGDCLVKHKAWTTIREQFPLMGMEEWESSRKESLYRRQRVFAGERVSSSLGEGKTLGWIYWEDGQDTHLYQKADLG